MELCSYFFVFCIAVFCLAALAAYFNRRGYRPLRRFQ